MGIAYTCIPRLSLSVVVWHGRIERDELFLHLQGMLADPDFQAMQRHLSDQRFSIIASSITLKQVWRIVDLLRSRRKNLSLRKFALVAGTEWDLLKQFEAAVLSVGVNAIVFNDLDRACVWLNVDAVEIGAELEKLRRKLRGISSGDS